MHARRANERRRLTYLRPLLLVSPVEHEPPARQEPTRFERSREGGVVLQARTYCEVPAQEMRKRPLVEGADPNVRLRTLGLGHTRRRELRATQTEIRKCRETFEAGVGHGERKGFDPEPDPKCAGAIVVASEVRRAQPKPDIEVVGERAEDEKGEAGARHPAAGRVILRIANLLGVVRIAGALPDASAERQTEDDTVTELRGDVEVRRRVLGVRGCRSRRGS